MRSFDVLSRQQNLYQSYVLEASAGTGKTFSIENIVARLIIDEDLDCLLEQLVVVTFTKAAAADLRARIRNKLVEIQLLSKALLKNPHSDTAQLPDYLVAIVEKGEKSLKNTSKRIDQAISNFDRASIFTIHGFCHRMLSDFQLESHIAILHDELEQLSPSLIRDVVKDFFRTKMDASLITPKQLSLLVKGDDSFIKLENQLMSLIQKGAEIIPSMNVASQVHRLRQAIEKLKTDFHLTSESISDDFHQLFPGYKEIADRQNRIKPQILKKLKRFLTLFVVPELGVEQLDILVEDGLIIPELFDASNLKANAKLPSPDKLHHPQLTEIIDNILGSLVREIRHTDCMTATLASHCQKMLEKRLQVQELSTFDGLLQSMLKAIDQSAFVDMIRKSFKAAIIDEFQDTDPVQWEIFKSLFLDHCPLYLVGDPKQSIYGFRQADIYTYINARETIGKDHCASLGRNFRSTPPLVDALNALFCPSLVPGLISLPRTQTHLPYLPVQCGRKVMANEWDDDRGSVHFLTLECSLETTGKNLNEIEENFLFPYIVQEIAFLHRKYQLQYRDIAILVGDRHQSRRIERCLTESNIPFVAQHGKLLVETIAYKALKELLKAIINPAQLSHLKAALGGPILAWDKEAFSALEDASVLEECMDRCFSLRSIWRTQNFGHFFHELLQSRWKRRFDASNPTVAEAILEKNGGIEFYRDLQQLAEYLSELEAASHHSPEDLLGVLESLERIEAGDSNAPKQRPDLDREGVQLLTIHSSKGLEFEIVFALGLLKRSPRHQGLIPSINASSKKLPPLIAVFEDADQNLNDHLSELDAEKMRQLYVTLTRARQRVYIPMLLGNGLGKCEIGCASAMELYLAQLTSKQTAQTDLYANIPIGDSGKIYGLIDHLAASHDIGLSRLESCDFLTDLHKDDSSYEEPIQQLLPPQLIPIPATTIEVDSFTSLSVKGHLEAAGSAPYRISEPGEFPSPFTLPAGRETGILLHAILEAIPFKIVHAGRLNSELLRFVEKHLQGSILADWRDVIAEMVYDTLTALLPVLPDPFSICNIDPLRCYREHEFIYPNGNGYIKGVIDLIFQHNEFYYIVDWKSNWLGPDKSCYDQMALNKAMEAHDYCLQADIYREAFKRFVKLSNNSFEKSFGGIIYPFLRGMRSGTSEGMIII